MYASNALLGLMNIEEPNEQQRTGALLVAEFVVRGIAIFKGLNGGK